MEAKETQNYAGKVTGSDELPPQDGYVTPEILAAQAGEQADFSMHVNKDDEDNPDA